MKRLLGLLVLGVIFWSCQNNSKKNITPYIYIPNQFNSIIKVNALNDFEQSATNNSVLKTLNKTKHKATSIILKNLNPESSVYLVHSKNDYLILTKHNPELFTLDSIPNQTSKTITNTDIIETKIDSVVFYHRIVDSIFTSSNNLEVLKSLTPQKNDELIRLIETTNNNAVASLIFKSGISDYSKLFLDSSNIKDDSNYTVLDLSFENNTLSYNGIHSANDSIVNAMDSFKNTIPQKINTLSIAPNNIKSLISISFDDYSVFNSNLNVVNPTNDSTSTFLNYVNEISKIENAVILHALDIDLAFNAIEEKEITETFRAIDIFKFEDTDFFKSRLKPFISLENSDYFSVYDDFLIFSNSTDELKSILTDVLSNNTLSNSNAYKSISEALSDEASLFIYKNAEGLSEVLETPQNKFNTNAVQFIYEDNYAHVNGILKTYKKKAAANSISEAFNITLDTIITSKPQALKNHITKGHDIAVQDINNTLYLISSSGNILWKKDLKAKILGNIQQIDIYKNGRLQLVFNTKNKLYVLDRNGKEVSPFPLKFNDEITQPIAVFDYDKTRNYRFLVTQGKALLMYNTKGKVVTGFDYKNSTNEVIKTPPKHFRIGRKDYIAFTTKNRLEILNRRGQTRIPVKDKIRFSDNDLFLYKNKFTSSNTLGQLIQVDTKGKVSSSSLNLSDKHHIETTSKTLVTMSENKLKIRSRTVDLDYGDYTPPKIYYLNDKIYVTVTDLQAKKVYLFDSQAKPIPNFPVYGTSQAVLTTLDRNKSLELITRSDDKTIIAYTIN